MGEPAQRHATAVPALEEPDRYDHLRMGVVGVAALLLVYLVDGIVLPFLAAGTIAFLLAPLLTRLTDRTRQPRLAVASLLFLLMLAAAGIAGWFFVPRAVADAEMMMRATEPTVADLARMVIGDHPIELFGWSVGPSQLAHATLAAVLQWLERLDTLGKLVHEGAAGASGLSLTLVLLFYFMADGPRVAEGLFWLVPPSHRRSARLVWSRLDHVLRGYFIGILIVAAYAGAAAYVGLGLILGVRHALLLAWLTGLLELVPVIGAIIAAAIAGLVALQTATGFGSIIAYTVYAVALRLSVDQVAEPLVLGNAAHLHPVVLIFCFLASLELFGIAGVFIAVPVALALKYSLRVLYDEPPVTNSR